MAALLKKAVAGLSSTKANVAPVARLCCPVAVPRYGCTDLCSTHHLAAWQQGWRMTPAHVACRVCRYHQSTPRVAGVQLTRWVGPLAVAPLPGWQHAPYPPPLRLPACAASDPLAAMGRGLMPIGTSCQTILPLPFASLCGCMHRRLQATNNGATATADSPKGSGPVPTVKIDNLSDPFATVVSMRGAAVLAGHAVVRRDWARESDGLAVLLAAGHCGVRGQAGRAAGHGRTAAQQAAAEP